MTILLLLVAVWIASSLGQTLLQFLQVQDHQDLKSFVFSSAVGLGFLSYCGYALGWLGLLSPVPIACLWSIAALAGQPGMKHQYLALHRGLHTLRDWYQALRNGDIDKYLKSAAILLLILFGAVELVACYKPPGPLEWDALAYHLADPKLYIALHRITLLPTEHHSNFPFTMEMLFAVGLMYGGYPLANLFHFVMEVLTVLMLIGYGDGLLGRKAGYFAALLFASTPLIVWESSVSYIDVCTSLYATLSILSYLSATVHGTAKAYASPSSRASMILSGITMGFALGTKYLALVPFGLLLILMLMRRSAVKNVAYYVLIAVAIASPWYIKNAMLMRNPVYPFYFRIFSHSRYWSKDKEQSYSSEQAGFGLPHSLSNPGVSIRNLLETPWRIVTDAERYYNQGEFNFCALIGGLYGALTLPLLLLRPRNRIVYDLYGLLVAQMIVWFFMAQVGRYLIQVLPIAALLAGYTTDRLLFSHRSYWFVKGMLGLLWIGQPAYTLWALVVLPTGGAEATHVKAQTGLDPTSVSMPENIEMMVSPGLRENYLHRRLDNYDVCQWINQNTARSEGVVLFEDTRGFYLNRPYLWGNGEHSSYIPYATIGSAAALSRWFSIHGYHYAIVNINWSPYNTRRSAITPDEASAAVMRWYADQHDPAQSAVGSWRTLLGQALRQGLWTIVYAEHGNVVLKITSP